VVLSCSQHHWVTVLRDERELGEGEQHNKEVPRRWVAISLVEPLASQNKHK